jgi:hypothetical protein
MRPAPTAILLLLFLRFSWKGIDRISLHTFDWKLFQLKANHEDFAAATAIQG